jgi:hypothetical protein
MLVLVTELGNSSYLVKMVYRVVPLQQRTSEHVEQWLKL